MKSELMKTYCAHSDADEEDQKSFNCKDCGVFMTKNGVVAYRTGEERFWAEVGVHRHFRSVLEEEKRVSSIQHFTESEQKEINEVL